MKKAVCLHEEDAGIMWKHTEYRTAHAEVRRARRLVLSFVATVVSLPQPPAAFKADRPSRLNTLCRPAFEECSCTKQSLSIDICSQLHLPLSCTTAPRNDKSIIAADNTTFAFTRRSTTNMLSIGIFPRCFLSCSLF